AAGYSPSLGLSSERDHEPRHREQSGLPGALGLAEGYPAEMVAAGVSNDKPFRFRLKRSYYTASETARN
ncbi:MAG TPA: hypothetical protein VJU17_03145, partial [Gemmatimonadales bacterium]|nr:hypothetical protein [Gemmatimonadales bacterium]